ncbi:MAG: hypothetical protein LBC70_03825 [Chitinispirillales bacterium]|jgi:hypothetical protein|nr:hypothetical protein [Chitinispirillales bacterium]
MVKKKDPSNSFMTKYSLLVYASLIALVLSGFLLYRIDSQSRSFHATVDKAHKASDGYDVMLLEMVSRLEDILAERASFGFAGNRDPMTGTRRTVAARPVITQRTVISRRTTPIAQEVVVAPVQVMEEPDPVRLTAIIFDNTRGTYTAVVMDGSRSLSVDVGDRVVDRRVTRITHDEIFMENARERFIYNIMGGNTRIPR